MALTPAHQWATSTISNPADRFTPVASATTAYAAVNALNQYPAVAGAAQGYDARGNLTANGALSFAYDAENRLMTASGAGLSAAYAYDPLGRRTTKTVSGTVISFNDAAANE